jgi:hypothetical protein
VTLQLDYLLAEEGYNDGWLAISQPAGCYSGTAMVYNRTDMLKQPFMWAIVQIKYMRQVWPTQVTPSTRYDSSNTSLLDRL